MNPGHILVADDDALAGVLASCDRGVRLVLQALVRHEGEAGVFYIRHPHEACGRITSLTLKASPTVTGDGVSSLRALIHADPRTGTVPHLYLDRLTDRLDSVPAAGQSVRLVFAGNHCKGSVFRNGASEITAALTARIEAIARALPDFHFGRIDLRYAMRARGAKPSSLRTMLRDWRNQRRLMARYPLND